MLSKYSLPCCCIATKLSYLTRSNFHVISGGKTQDERFERTEQSVLPIDIKLMPSLQNTAGAKSVTIDEQPAGTFVAEGLAGFNSTYDVYLRPCTLELRDIIEVTMMESMSSQIILTPSILYGNDFSNAECKATVEVSAVNDAVGEGDHFVNIQHDVKNKDSGEDILLTDGSSLLAANVLVQIYDDDIAGVIIEETNGITATAEIRNEDKELNLSDASLYEDAYYLRLTKEPVGTVEIMLNSIAVAADQGSTASIQVLVNSQTSDVLTFDSTNWDQKVKVLVTAIDDGEYRFLSSIRPSFFCAKTPLIITMQTCNEL